MQFVLPVTENGVRQRHSTTLHMMLAFLLFGIGVTVEALYWFMTVSKNFEKTGPYKPFLFFGIACLLVAVVIIILNFFQKSWLRKESNNLLFRGIELLLLATSSLLFFINGWKSPAILFGVMTAVVVFAIIREKAGSRAGGIVIDDKGVQFNKSGRTKSLDWREIESVLLRFGVVTIEYADNHLLQENIGQPIPDATLLEAYCKEKIESHRSERLKDW